MQIHDWTKVPAGLFHDFHQSWSIRIKDDLNAGRLPKGLSALVEKRAGPREPDVLAVERRSNPQRPDAILNGGMQTLDRPTTSIVRRTTKEIYSGRANRIVVKHHLGRIVAVIEILSPGNKDSGLLCVISSKKRSISCAREFTCCWSICSRPRPEIHLACTR
jgi:hypothetical protein